MYQSKTKYRKPPAIKELEVMTFVEHYRGRTIPEYAKFRRSFDDRTANGLTKCIITFLKLKGWHAERVSVTGRLIDNTKTYQDVCGRTRTIGTKKYIPSSMQKGSADIAATINGKSVKIEVKVGSDRQSPAQLEYQRQIEHAGGVYVIAKDFEGFKTWFDQFSKLK